MSKPIPIATAKAIVLEHDVDYVLILGVNDDGSAESATFGRLPEHKDKAAALFRWFVKHGLRGDPEQIKVHDDQRAANAAALAQSPAEDVVVKAHEAARKIGEDACGLYCQWFERGTPTYMDGGMVAYEMVSAIRSMLAAISQSVPEEGGAAVSYYPRSDYPEENVTGGVLRDMPGDAARAALRRCTRLSPQYGDTLGNDNERDINTVLAALHRLDELEGELVLGPRPASLPPLPQKKEDAP